MGCLSDDLDRFLKTEGIRILSFPGRNRTGSWRPLSEEETEGFRSIHPETFGSGDLECLMDRLDVLLDALERREPKDRNSEAYSQWEDRMWETERLMDRVQDCLDAAYEA